MCYKISYYLECISKDTTQECKHLSPKKKHCYIKYLKVHFTNPFSSCLFLLLGPAGPGGHPRVAGPAGFDGYVVLLQPDAPPASHTYHRLPASLLPAALLGAAAAGRRLPPPRQPGPLCPPEPLQHRPPPTVCQPARSPAATGRRRRPAGQLHPPGLPEPLRHSEDGLRVGEPARGAHTTPRAP